MAVIYGNALGEDARAWAAGELSGEEYFARAREIEKVKSKEEVAQRLGEMLGRPYPEPTLFECVRNLGSRAIEFFRNSAER